MIYSVMHVVLHLSNKQANWLYFIIFHHFHLTKKQQLQLLATSLITTFFTFWFYQTLLQKSDTLAFAYRKMQKTTASSILCKLITSINWSSILLLVYQLRSLATIRYFYVASSLSIHSSLMFEKIRCMCPSAYGVWIATANSQVLQLWRNDECILILDLAKEQYNKFVSFLKSDFKWISNQNQWLQLGIIFFFP